MTRSSLLMLIHVIHISEYILAHSDMYLHSDVDIAVVVLSTHTVPEPTFTDRQLQLLVSRVEGKMSRAATAARSGRRREARGGQNAGFNVQR